MSNEYGGNNPYTGTPYCGNCYPYGPPFPSDPNAPLSSECLPNPGVPCPTPAAPGQPRPTGICDPRFQDLPQATRVRLFGADGKCLYRLPAKQKGVVMSDEMGEYITQRPCIELPYRQDYQMDGNGQVLLDENGDPIQAPVPCFDSIVISDACGCQNRVKGLPGVIQDIEWNGEEFCFKEQTVRDNNPLIDPKDVPVIDTLCPAPLHAVLIPTTQQIYVNGQQETVSGYKIGGTYETGIPAGTMQMWAGAFTNIPGGWLLCDGASYDTVAQAELFGAIGYLWGGTGSNFNVPDMRGRFARGTDLGAGNDPDAGARTESALGSNTGDNVGSLQTDQMQCFSAGTYQRYFVQAESVKQTTGVGSSKNVARDTNQYTDVPIVFVENGCGEPRFGSETRPENVYVNYIIRAGCPPIA